MEELQAILLETSQFQMAAILENKNWEEELEDWKLVRISRER